MAESGKRFLSQPGRPRGLSKRRGSGGRRAGILKRNEVRYLAGAMSGLFHAPGDEEAAEELPPTDVYIPGAFRDLAAAGREPARLARCVQALRGYKIDLPWPKGFDLDVRGRDDTILTAEDLDNWKRSSYMDGVVTVIGTIGPKRCMEWDRKVIGACAKGVLYTYHVSTRSCYVVLAAQSVERLLTCGLVRSYFETLTRVGEYCLKSVRRSSRHRRPESHEPASLFGLYGLTGSPRAVPLESSNILRADLDDVDLTDEMFVSSNRVASWF